MDPKNLIQIVSILLTCYRVAGVGMSAPRPYAATNSPTERKPISEDPCSMVQQFAKDEAAFSTCAITSGNNMCKKCVSEIRQLTNTYTKLMADDNVIRYADSKCLQSIISDSSRDRFSTYYSHSRSMWFMNNCDSKYYSVVASSVTEPDPIPSRLLQRVNVKHDS